jgi:CheY-like chemotaxis protein
MLDIVSPCTLPPVQYGSIVTNSKPLPAMRARSNLRVAVVDDNYDANASLSRLLEASGFQVAGRAYDGVAGLTIIKSTHPDVAIVDIAMPALDGYSLARRIKSEMDRPPRLIALTGFGKESDKDAAISAGFDAFLIKPASWPALESLLLGFDKGNG